MELLGASLLFGQSAPTIVSQPQDVVTLSGQSASFQIVASGAASTLQWRKNGFPIAGATGANFSIAPVSTFDEGAYDVVVSNGAEQIRSRIAALKVAPLKYPEKIGIDPTFQTTIERDQGSVYSIVVQPDGKVVVGGAFVRINGVPRHNLARLNADGSVDPDFNPGAGPSGLVRSVALQPDGKILIAGDFVVYAGVARNFLARVNADGTLDTDFHPASSGPSREVNAIAVQPDGKIVIVGGFQQYDGQSRSYIARLTASGGLDQTFNPGLGVSAVTSAVAIGANGKIVIGGSFVRYNGELRNGIAVINVDGSLDSSFVPGTNGGSEWVVRSLAVLSDGKVLAGGLGVPLRRFNADGALDPKFPAAGGPNGIVSAISVQPDGQVLVGGDFTTYDGKARNHMARFKADGSLDASFDPTAGSETQFQAMATQADGKIVIGGLFSPVDKSMRTTIWRLESSGAFDSAFTSEFRSAGRVSALVRQPDGKFIVGGAFDFVNDAKHAGLARLNSDGTVDANFNPQADGGTASVDALALQPDGKIVVGGTFTGINGQYRNHLARVSADGALDADFAQVGTNYSVNAVAVQPDGAILIGGAFTFVNTTVQNHLARLQPDGALDASFTPGAGPDSWVTSIAPQVDGAVIIGGYFNNYAGATRRGVARVSSAGSLDTAYNSSGGALPGLPGSLSVTPDGRLYAGGSFYLNGVSLVHALRLDASGQIDSSFVASGGSVGSVGAIYAQADGRVIAAQQVSSSSYPPPVGLVRFSSAGVLDSSLSVAGMSDAKASRIVLLDDGSLLLAGEVFCDESSVRTGLARLVPEAVPTITAPNAATFLVGQSGSFALTASGVPAPVFEITRGDIPFWARFGGNALRGTPANTAGSPFTFYVRARNSAGVSAEFPITLTVASLPAIAMQPKGAMAGLGGTVKLAVEATANPAPAYQWRKNGVDVTGATNATLTIEDFDVADSGAYSVVVSNAGGTLISDAAIVGLASSVKVAGAGAEVGADIHHSNGHVYDQILLTGPAVAVTADPEQVTRISFIDLTDDIVQVEFSGAGTLSLVLENAGQPAPPKNYNQAVNYIKGHARVVIVGADESSNLSIFSVGRANAVNQALFRDNVSYDGVADIASVSIQSAKGKFGGVRLANASLFATNGITGIAAAGVSPVGPVYVGDINAANEATGVLQFDAVRSVRITGGDLRQSNGRAIEVGGVSKVEFGDGYTSHGVLVPAQTNQARFDTNGVDVTNEIVAH